MLSDNLNITRSYLISIECQFSYQHLTFIMLNDILVSDLLKSAVLQWWKVKTKGSKATHFLKFAATRFLTEGFLTAQFDG